MARVVEDLLEPLVKARDVGILTGAGLSAESGVPTFRDGATGLWTNADPDSVASIKGFENGPEAVWAWHEAMHSICFNARPNAGHKGVASLEWLLPRARVTVITQNIDGLQQAAGSSRVLEIHGSALRVRCHQRCGFSIAWREVPMVSRQCPTCGAPARPDVVWFGEPLEGFQFSLAIKATLSADVFITIGTSASVYPAASLPLAAKENGALLIEVNPHETPITKHVDLSVRLGASDFFSELSSLLATGNTTVAVPVSLEIGSRHGAVQLLRTAVQRIADYVLGERRDPTAGHFRGPHSANGHCRSNDERDGSHCR